MAGGISRGLKSFKWRSWYANFRENHRFQIPEGCHWEDVRSVTVDVGKTSKIL